MALSIIALRSRESLMMKRVMCAAIVLCVASNANAATLRLKSYLTPEDEKQRFMNEIYLDGMKDGLIAFNVALARTGAAPLFCLPPNVCVCRRSAFLSSSFILERARSADRDGAGPHRRRHLTKIGAESETLRSFSLLP
jgi:hypothetical protein